MSDELGPKDDELIKTLIRKNANLKCPVCAHDTMMLVERASNDEFSVFEVFKARRGQDPVRYAEVQTVAIACANCGFLRQFVLDALLNESVPAP